MYFRKICTNIQKFNYNLYLSCLVERGRGEFCEVHPARSTIAGFPGSLLEYLKVLLHPASFPSSIHPQLSCRLLPILSCLFLPLEPVDYDFSSSFCVKH